MERVDAVYDILWGLLEEEYQINGVDDLFAPGMVCAEYYERMLMACGRLNERLGSRGEDRDVECVVDCLLAICREVGKEMYACGKRLG